MVGSDRTFVAKEPKACTDLAEVRAGIDEVDGRLIELLARRLAYAEQTARLKDERTAVRDEARITQVIANALARGAQCGLPAALVGPIWRAMIEAYVAHELSAFDARRSATDLALHLSLGRPWAS